MKNQKNFTQNKRGFALLEILVILVIAGFVAVFAVVALGNARVNNRDTIRVTDIIQIRSGLELYFYNCNKYPVSLKPGGVIGDEECGGPYLSFVPFDPQTRAPYRYIPCHNEDCQEGITNANGYMIGYILEKGTGRVLGGKHIATPEKLY